MAPIYSTRELLSPGVFMATLYLKDAYLHIRIREMLKKFLRFAVKVETLLVQHPAIRPVISPTDFYQGPGGSTLRPKVKRNRNNFFFGRPMAICLISGQAKANFGHHDQIPSKSWVADQRRQVSTFSGRKSDLLRLLHQLSKDQDFPDGRESKVSVTGHTQTTPGVCILYLGTHEHSKTDDSSHAQGTVGTATYEISQELCTFSMEQLANIIRSVGACSRSSERNN